MGWANVLANMRARQAANQPGAIYGATDLSYYDPYAAEKMFQRGYGDAYGGLEQVDPRILAAVEQRTLAESGARERSFLQNLAGSPDQVAPGQYGVFANLARLRSGSDLSRNLNTAYLQEAERAQGYRTQRAQGLQDFLQSQLVAGQNYLRGIDTIGAQGRAQEGVQRAGKQKGVTAGFGGPSGPSIGYSFSTGGLTPPRPTPAIVGEQGSELVIPHNVLAGGPAAALAFLNAAMGGGMEPDTTTGPPIALSPGYNASAALADRAQGGAADVGLAGPMDGSAMFPQIGTEPTPPTPHSPVQPRGGWERIAHVFGDQPFSVQTDLSGKNAGLGVLLSLLGMFANYQTGKASKRLADQEMQDKTAQDLEQAVYAERLKSFLRRYEKASELAGKNPEPVPTVGVPGYRVPIKSMADYGNAADRNLIPGEKPKPTKPKAPKAPTIKPDSDAALAGKDEILERIQSATSEDELTAIALGAARNKNLFSTQRRQIGAAIIARRKSVGRGQAR